MAKLDEQIRTMKGYFEADCEAEGKLSLGLEVEHFVTHSDGRAVTFAQLQAALRDLQQQGDAGCLDGGGGLVLQFLQLAENGSRQAKLPECG